MNNYQKNSTQKPSSPNKQSLFQTGSLRNRNQSPVNLLQKQSMKSQEKSFILDETFTNNNFLKQTAEIHSNNSFQTESNMKESIDQIVQNLTFKLKLQETDFFIKELSNPFLTQDPSVLLYQAPIEKSSSTLDLLGKIMAQESKKAIAIKQFILNSVQSNDQSFNTSINSSFINQQQKIQQGNVSNKVKQINGGNPQKSQNKAFLQETHSDQKSNLILGQQIKQLEQLYQNMNQQQSQFNEYIKKQNSDIQSQINSQSTKIQSLQSFFAKIDQEQNRERQITQELQMKNEKQEINENQTNQEVQKQLQLVMKNLNSLAEHQQQQMIIIKTTLTSELKNEFQCSSECKLNQQELQTQLTILKDTIKQIQQQSQEMLIRKQQMQESLNLEIKNLMNVNKQKNEEIDQIKLQNDAIIIQINNNKEEITKQNQLIYEIQNSQQKCNQLLTIYEK